MPRVIGWSRYLIIIPIIGLLLAAATMFVVGGFGLVRAVIDTVAQSLAGAAATAAQDEALPFEVEIVKYVDLFLIGTVLFITAAGFFQLFIAEVDLPRWLSVDSIEELETNLIGVTVVVLAVQFMAVVFTLSPDDLMRYGIGIAFPIAALALFVGLRAWSTGKSKISDRAIRLIDQYGDDYFQAKTNVVEKPDGE